MDEYFVRLYHMKDGTSQSPNAVYELREHACADLNKFNDIENVSYATVEQRFARNFW